MPADSTCSALDAVHRKALDAIIADIGLPGETAFSPSHKREYIEWISEAKTTETRQRRMDTALEWLTQGKPRNWKYLKQG